MNNSDMAIELINQLKIVLEMVGVHIPAMVICAHGGEHEKDSQVVITEKDYPFLREALREAMDKSGMYQQVKPAPAPAQVEKRCHVRTFRGSI